MKKLFTSDKFFLAMVLCAVVNCIITSLIFYKTNDVPIIDYLPAGIILIGCLTALYVSYQKHSKNVMKGIMGALLMNLLLRSIHNISASAQNEIPFAIIHYILLVVLFINHFTINSDHHSNQKMIRLNQIIVVFIVVNVFIWDILSIIDSPNSANIILSLIDIVGYCSVIASVVCVESRLDAYRLDREAAGWTEEKGYPEGYVHEYEKNNKS